MLQPAYCPCQQWPTDFPTLTTTAGLSGTDDASLRCFPFTKISVIPLLHTPGPTGRSTVRALGHLSQQGRPSFTLPPNFKCLFFPQNRIVFSLLSGKLGNVCSLQFCIKMLLCLSKFLTKSPLIVIRIYVKSKREILWCLQCKHFKGTG